MQVIKRNGYKENVEFDKITKRINNLIQENDKNEIDSAKVAHQTIQDMYSNIKTEELDNISASICAGFTSINPKYSNLGGRILVSNLHKKNKLDFSDKMILYNDISNNLDPEFLTFVCKNKEKINKIPDYK